MRKHAQTPPIAGMLLGNLSEHLAKQFSGQLDYKTRAPLWIKVGINRVRQLKFQIREYLNAHEPQDD